MLKGSIELQTEPGRGTRLTIRLPARLAFETAMIVRVDGQAFALPVAQIESRPAAGNRSGWQNSQAQTSGPSAAHFVTFRDQPHPGGPRPQKCWRLPARLRRHGLSFLWFVRQTAWSALPSIASREPRIWSSSRWERSLAGHPVISGTSLSVSGEVISILNPSGLQRWMSEGLPPEPAEPTGSGKALGRRPGFAVLVVDDSISVRRVIARHLEAMGLDVDEVSDGLEALGRLRSRPYGLVVTDLEMPRLDGFELLAEMQRSEPLAPIP